MQEEAEEAPGRRASGESHGRMRRTPCPMKRAFDLNGTVFLPRRRFAPYGDMGALPKRHRHGKPQRSSLIKFFPPFFTDMTAFQPARDGEFLLKWT